MINVSGHIDIEATPEVVWAELVDELGMPRPPGAVGAGELEVATADRPHHASFIGSSGGASYSLAPNNGVTRFTYGRWREPGGIGRVAAPVLRRVDRRRMDRDLSQLKIDVESRGERVGDRRN